MPRSDSPTLREVWPCPSPSGQRPGSAQLAMQRPGYRANDQSRGMLARKSASPTWYVWRGDGDVGPCPVPSSRPNDAGAAIATMACGGRLT
eukprot:CAMPEP_0170434292 /NCGR_PEP_ID=MMETSP0117_2-20130122/42968_1 /TAXON_ID=400756 /ORGANISM="Durinskia baltica, Strain CSIRO CS-38" /LENGTH=90 /DNA_ID=CAMNT_0010694127 /DNA_START=28 /DNA_END=297 /DNA_ORIENTATION=-